MKMAQLSKNDNSEDRNNLPAYRILKCKSLEENAHLF